jgi:hypothetical protein
MGACQDGGSGSRRAGSALSPTGQTHHDMLQNFFKSLLNTKDCSVSLGSASAVSPGVTAGKAGTFMFICAM